jgi:O-antigen/teichoic acid export membrane protein
VIALSGFIANHWIKVEQLPEFEVRRSVILMGLVIAFQWPISLYSGGLTGLDKQVLNNVIVIVMSTLRAAGVLLVLHYYSPTITTFFIWQAVLSLIFVIVIRGYLWKSMPPFHERPKFSKEELRNIWRFALGMTGISAISFFLTQIDKIFLSKILPLSQFGYYMLAFTVASGISLIVTPISITFFPKFVSIIALKKEEELKDLYHKACRLMATFIFPICFVLIFFIQEILIIWTRNPVTTANTYLMAQVLIAGTMMNSLMVTPYLLIIAHGWTRFSFYQNLIASIILIPLLFWWTSMYGALGGTFVWLFLNAGYILISQPLMHRRLLKHELTRWYFDDTLLPMIAPLLIVLALRLGVNSFFGKVHLNIIMIGAIFFIAVAGSVIFMPEVRLMLKKAYKRYFYEYGKSQ